jgi:hypothetical protein
VLLIAAAILAARKLAQYDAGKRVPATMCAISDAIRGPRLPAVLSSQLLKIPSLFGFPHTEEERRSCCEKN